MQIEIIVFIIVGFNVAMVIGLNVVAYYRFKPLFREMDANAKYVAELSARIDRNIAENWRRIAQMRAQWRRNRHASVAFSSNSRQCARTRFAQQQRSL